MVSPIQPSEGEAPRLRPLLPRTCHNLTRTFTLTPKVKHHGYDRFYPLFLEPLRERNAAAPIKMFEIGYLHGESFRMWSQVTETSRVYIWKSIVNCLRLGHYTVIANQYFPGAQVQNDCACLAVYLPAPVPTASPSPRATHLRCSPGLSPDLSQLNPTPTPLPARHTGVFHGEGQTVTGQSPLPRGPGLLRGPGASSRGHNPSHSTSSNPAPAAAQGNTQDLQRLLDDRGLAEQLDFVIDDGSHHPQHQVVSFQFLFEKALKPGGVYIVSTHLSPPPTQVMRMHPLN
jgi:hypothetical protein